MTRGGLGLVALLLGGCGPAPVRGLIEASSPAPARLAAAHPSVALLPAEDARPAGERRWYPQAAAELGAALGRGLGPVRIDERAPRRLAVRLLRLPDPRKRSYASARVEARLSDERGALLWQATAEATSPLAEGAWREALSQAVAQATGDLASRLGWLLAQGPGGAAGAVAPSVFLVERVSQRRDLVETLYIETISAQVLRHEVAPIDDPALARPGDWLLSRRTVEGLVLSGPGYDALIRALSPRYDLRQLDDAYRVHFFGLRPPPP